MKTHIKTKTVIIGIDSDGGEIEIQPESYLVNIGPDWNFLYHDEIGQWLDIKEPMGADYKSWLDEIEKGE